jgi:hypothetical protein
MAGDRAFATQRVQPSGVKRGEHCYRYEPPGTDVQSDHGNRQLPSPAQVAQVRRPRSRHRGHDIRQAASGETVYQQLSLSYSAHSRKSETTIVKLDLLRARLLGALHERMQPQAQISRQSPRGRRFTARGLK